MTITSAGSGRALRVLTALALVTAFSLLTLATGQSAQASAGQRLVGLFRLDAGSCSKTSISGTYFRMILKSGGPSGPYLSNSDSPCSDQSFTPLGGGSDGGLSTTGYQEPPSPPFDSSGNATAGRITAPAKFFGTNFATGTAAKDAQTGARVPVPSVTANGSSLSADLRAFSVTWNKQYFNQGSPKPNGSLPGNTRKATGTYDAASGHFTLDWTSQIQGGPFDGFTGKWHLEGTFYPAPGSNSGTSSGDSTGTTDSGGSNSTNSGGGPATTPGAPTAPGAAPGAPGVSDGASTAPGRAPSGTSSKGAAGPGSPGTSSSAAPVGGAVTPTAASTNTTTKPVWQVSWPVIFVALIIAVLGFLSLIALRLAERRKGIS